MLRQSSADNNHTHLEFDATSSCFDFKSAASLVAAKQGSEGQGGRFGVAKLLFSTQWSFDAKVVCVCRDKYGTFSSQRCSSLRPNVVTATLTLWRRLPTLLGKGRKRQGLLQLVAAVTFLMAFVIHSVINSGGTVACRFQNGAANDALVS